MKRDDGCGRCAPEERAPGAPRNRVPGAKSFESPAETEERKWIVCLMRRRPRALTSTERRVLNLLYAIDGSRRETCATVADQIEASGTEAVHRIAVEALVKIGYVKKSRRPRGS